MAIFWAVFSWPTLSCCGAFCPSGALRSNSVLAVDLLLFSCTRQAGRCRFRRSSDCPRAPRPSDIPPLGNTVDGPSRLSWGSRRTKSMPPYNVFDRFERFHCVAFTRLLQPWFELVPGHTHRLVRTPSPTLGTSAPHNACLCNFQMTDVLAIVVADGENVLSRQFGFHGVASVKAFGANNVVTIRLRNHCTAAFLAMLLPGVRTGLEDQRRER